MLVRGFYCEGGDGKRGVVERSEFWGEGNKVAMFPVINSRKTLS